MKCIVLAAGYAIRMYPVTLNKPKALLTIAGKSIIDHIIMMINKISNIEEVIIITNGIFYTQFESWLRNANYDIKIVVISDETYSNEDRKGAMKDLYIAIEKCLIEHDDIFVLASDNIIHGDIQKYVEYFHEKKKSCILAYKESCIDNLRKTGVAKINNLGLLIDFKEKPQEPDSDLAVPPAYLISKNDVILIKQFVLNNNNTDSLGNFIKWLMDKTSINVYVSDYKRFDIGCLNSYYQTELFFRQEEKA